MQTFHKTPTYIGIELRSRFLKRRGKWGDITKAKVHYVLVIAVCHRPVKSLVGGGWWWLLNWKILKTLHKHVQCRWSVQVQHCIALLITFKYNSRLEHGFRVDWCITDHMVSLLRTHSNAWTCCFYKPAPIAYPFFTFDETLHKGVRNMPTFNVVCPSTEL